MNVRNYLNELKNTFNIENDAQLAEKLNTSKTALDKWIVRNKIPDRIQKNLLEKEKVNILSTKTIKITHISIKLLNSKVNKIGELILDKTFINDNLEKLFTFQLEENKEWVIFNDKMDFIGDGLYIINWNNLLMYKKIVATPKKNIVLIQSLNEEQTWEFNINDKSDSFSIYGKVIKVIS